MEMAMRTHGKLRPAFTLVEFLVVVAIVAVLLLLLIPRSTGNRASPNRIRCINNLKQIGIAWRLARGDGDVYAELPNRGELNAATPDGGYTYQYFGILSNDLNTPKLLVCPVDERTPHTNFDMLKGNKSPGPFLNNTTVSYFIGRDAQEPLPQMILTGDRNIAATSAATDYGYSPDPNIATGNFVALGTNNSTLGWTLKMHNRVGNILFADGHVETLTSSRLRSCLAATGDTNRPANAILFP